MSTSPSLPAVHSVVLRIVGVFEIATGGKGVVPTRKRIEDAHFTRESLDLARCKLFRDLFYPSFASVMFFGRALGEAAKFRREEDEAATEVRRRVVGLRAELVRQGRDGERRTPFAFDHAEVLMFQEPALGIFAVDVGIGASPSLDVVSELSFGLRGFDAKVSIDGDEAVDLAAVLEQRVLGGVRVRGDDIEVDEYSGSKFRTFCVVDLEEPVEAGRRRELLYDLGCGVPLGAAAGDGYFSPAPAYYAKLMAGVVSAFRNYDALPLLDSFTVVGDGLLRRPLEVDKWRTTYFRLYAFNLFVKYSLHRYAARLATESPVALRQRFELFLSRYEVGRVSFNFLPELLHAAMRQALGLDDELARLRERIRGLSARIQEDQAERANALLGLVSALGTLSGAGAAFTVLKEGQEALGWRPGTFWTLFGLLVLVAVLAVATYMFPHHRRKLLKRWRRST